MAESTATMVLAAEPAPVSVRVEKFGHELTLQVSVSPSS